MSTCSCRSSQQAQDAGELEARERVAPQKVSGLGRRGRLGARDDLRRRTKKARVLLLLGYPEGTSASSTARAKHSASACNLTSASLLTPAQTPSPPRPSNSLTAPPPPPPSSPPPLPALPFRLPPSLGLCFVEFARPALRGPRSTSFTRNHSPGSTTTPLTQSRLLRKLPSPTNGRRDHPHLSMRSSYACQR